MDAHFELPIIRVFKDGNGSGIVISDPPGITCGPFCSALFPPGSSVTLTATPATGFVFAGWSGPCTGTGPCTVTMTDARNVTATFALPTVSVAKTGSGSGTVTSDPPGISCGGTCSATFPIASNVTLSATPTPGSAFTGWSGACTGTGDCTVSMTEPRSVTAAFTLLTLSVAKTGTGSGTVTSDPPGISCGGTCSATAPYGTLVTLTATPTPGSAFTGWSGACIGTGDCTVSMTEPRSVTATFAIQSFTLTVTLAGSGSGFVISTPAGIDCVESCGAAFLYNTTVSLIATPLGDSSFLGWSGEGCGGTGNCVLTMTQARNVTAVFFAGSLPTVTLALNQAAFQSGQTQYLTATTVPGSAPLAVDAYVALGLPGGTLLFLQGDGSFTPEWRPFASNWTVAPYYGALFTYPFTGGELVGAYTWYVAFTLPGTHPLMGTVGPIGMATFSFTP